MKKLLLVLIISTSVYSQEYNNLISFDEVLSDVSEYIELAKTDKKMLEVKAKELDISYEVLEQLNGIPTVFELKVPYAENSRIYLNYENYCESKTPTKIKFSYDSMYGEIPLKGTKHKAIGLSFTIESDGNISEFRYTTLNYLDWEYKLKTERIGECKESRLVTKDTISLYQLGKKNDKYSPLRSVDTHYFKDRDGEMKNISRYSTESYYFEFESDSEIIEKTEHWVSKEGFENYLKKSLFPSFNKPKWIIKDRDFNNYEGSLEKNTSYIDKTTLFLVERMEYEHPRRMPVPPLSGRQFKKTKKSYIPPYKVYDYTEFENIEKLTYISSAYEQRVIAKFPNPNLIRSANGDTLFYLNTKDFEKILNNGVIKEYSQVGAQKRDNQGEWIMDFRRFVRKEMIIKNGYLSRVNLFAYNKDEEIAYLAETTYFDTNSVENLLKVRDLYRLRNYSLQGKYKKGDWDKDESEIEGKSKPKSIVVNYKSGYINYIKHYGPSGVSNSNKPIEKFDDGFKLNDNFITQKLVSEINQKNKEALADFTKAIELDPDDAYAYYTRGNAKKKLKDYYGAINDYSKAIELKPDYAFAYVNRGNVKFKFSKDYKGAIEDYSRAIELDPDYKPAYYNRGNAKYKLKDYKGAIEDYSRAIELDPNNTAAYYIRGIAKYDLNDIGGACKDVRKAVSLGYDDSQNFIGQICN